MTSFRELRTILILVAVFFGLWLLVGSESPERETDPRRSSLNSTFPGFKAWYLLLEELGREPKRLTGQFPKRIEHDGTLVLSAPSVPLEDEERAAIFSWVREGGHLFLVQEQVGQQSFTDLLENEEEKPENIRMDLDRATTLDKAVSPGRNTPLTRYIGKLHVGGRRYTRLPEKAQTLYRDKHGVILATWRQGEGRITALSDASALSNRFIDREGNARLAAWVSQYGPVLFDEVHQGYSSAPKEPSLWDALGAPVHLAFYQLVFAALFMAWTFSRRFGRAMTPPFLDRRTAGEYVVSMGGLLKRSHAETTALETVGHAFRRELAASVGLPPDAPDDHLLEAVSDRTDMPPETLQRALEASHGRPPAGMNPLEAYRLIATVREELNLNGRTAAAPRTFA